MKRVLAVVVCFVSAAAFAQVSLQAAEDRRLLEFLDAAFDEAAAMHPEMLTALGSKRHYDRLDDYTDAGVKKDLALAERQVARLRREFDERLGSIASIPCRMRKTIWFRVCHSLCCRPLLTLRRATCPEPCRLSRLLHASKHRRRLV